MGLKAGSTNYQQNQTVSRRHQRTGVGETYGQREGFQRRENAADSQQSAFGKIKGKVKDFFRGSKLPAHPFMANASYVRGSTITESHKMIEQGVQAAGGRSTDQDLLADLQIVEQSFSRKRV